jgi:iron complex transport system ATP-binding protein
MAAVEVSHLCVGYQNRIILNDLSFTADRGILTILGANGSGKSSLLHCVSGLIKPMSGTVLINQKSLSSMKRNTVARELAIVPQEHHPSFAYMVEDIVLMGRTPYVSDFGLPADHDREIAAEVMETIRISHLRKRSYTELSGGERRLVLIAMAICQQTSVLIMDEPTSFLDVKNTSVILDVILRLAQDENKTIIIAIHDINHAFVCSDEALLIVDRDTVVKGRLDDIINERNLSRMYNMEFELGRTNSNRRYVVPIV